MSALLAFMLIVSCTDSYQTCALAENIRPFPNEAVCEAELGKTLRGFSRADGKQQETVLARCVSGASTQALSAANDNNKQGSAPYGTIFWQVSQAGDLLASMQPAEKARAAAQHEAEQASPLYAENIAAQGVRQIELSPALTAAADSAAIADKAAEKPVFHSSILTLYGKFGRKKSLQAQAEPQNREAFLPGYSAKYIYETADFGQAYYANASMPIVWGRAAPLSMAAFAIDKEEPVYMMPARELTALQGAAANALLPAGTQLQQDIFFRRLFAASDKNAASAEEEGAGGSAARNGNIYAV